MNHFVGQVFKSENSGTSPNVAFLEPVAFVNSVLAGHEGVAPDVELPSEVQKRSIYVLLTIFTPYYIMYVFSFPFLCNSFLFKIPSI